MGVKTTIMASDPTRWYDHVSSLTTKACASVQIAAAPKAASKAEDSDDCDLFGDDDEEEEAKPKETPQGWLPARRQRPRPRRRRLPQSASPPLSSTSSLRALTVTTMMKTLVEPSTSLTSSHS